MLKIKNKDEIKIYTIKNILMKFELKPSIKKEKMKLGRPHS